jgi:hypothetical protein
MKFSLRSLFAFTALVAVSLWAWLYLSVRFEFEPMYYVNGQLRFTYSVSMEINP